MALDPKAIRGFLQSLQAEVCAALEDADGTARFVPDDMQTSGGGISAPRVLSGGAVIERAGVNFTHSVGDQLPKAASQRRPQLAGRAFQAVSLSLIVHPRNPHVPTTHANFRYFEATMPGQAPIWWFGGGFDLTPYYGYDEDAVHWHKTAKAACDPFGEAVYPRLKQACDEYFYLPHRQEPRGIGGIFFDDWTEGGSAQSLAFMKSVAKHFLPAYLPILQRRKDMPVTEAQRQFQLYRRGRYVEFNLVYDQGTKYGIQSGRRIESVMCSMPPLVRWEYGLDIAPGSMEAQLYDRYLKPQDWADM
jgi:coproporphyrinogen III oxidase